MRTAGEVAILKRVARRETGAAEAAVAARDVAGRIGKVFRYTISFAECSSLRDRGVVAEWFKAAVLKTAKGESPS